jgi:hypothetical protein
MRRALAFELNSLPIIGSLHSFKEDYPFDAGAAENVPIKPCQGANTRTILQYFIPGYSLV